MSSNTLPSYIESETDQILETALEKDFETLQTYAYNYGNYLLDDPLYRSFELAHTNSRILISILLEFTTHFANRNIEAIKRLRTLQRTNLRLATNAYERLISPHLRLRMYQQRANTSQDSPILRILTPPRSNTPVPPENILSTSRTQNNRRNTPRQRRCYKCRQTTHEKRHCPYYRCPHCRHLQPGHIARYCPEKPSSDSWEQDYYHDYDPDGNLDGER